MATELPRFRVFLSSPGDVKDERQKAALVLDRLRKVYARYLRIEPYLWEYEPMLATGHFQDVIEPPSTSDLMVLILWSRLGTPLPEKTPTREYRARDGHAPVTGTEWEFEEAVEAQRLRGAPAVLVYRNRTVPGSRGLDLRDRKSVALAQEQIEALDHFWEQHFADKGAFKTAYASYHTLPEFELKLESDLRKCIEEHLRQLRERKLAVPPQAIWPGNPFRGLEAYAYEHAAIYFGRGRAIDAAIGRLQAGAEQARACILLLGASGSGKSSLAQAGIVPALSATGVVPGVGQWRRAVVNPGNDAAGPFAALAQALVEAHALPELAATEQRRSRLAESLQSSAAELIRRALEDIGERERSQNRLLYHEHVNLALVVDQLEELYTRADVTASVRSAFTETLRALAATGVVYIVATLRSDQWHRTAETPGFAALAEKLDVLPAGPAELIEILRSTAEAAGIAFEQDETTGVGLDAVLAEEAAGEPGALPLLSYLLDRLYRQDIEIAGGSTLRYASAQAQGGLKGAIAQRADEVLNAQPEPIRAALPRMLRALVTISQGDALPTTRQAQMEQFPAGTPVRQLVEALLDSSARLLVSDTHGTSTRVRLAHEALLTQWAAAREQLRIDRADLQVWARLDGADALWREKARDETLLARRGVQLDEARDLLRRRGEELPPALREYIELSAAVEQRNRDAEKRAVRRRLMLLTAAAVVLLVIGAVGIRKALEQVRVGQSSAAAERALKLLGEHRYREIITLALANLPSQAARPSRPLNYELMAALEAAVERNHLRLRLAGYDYDDKTKLVSFAFDPAGNRLLTASNDGTAILWDAQSGQVIRILGSYGAALCCARFSPDGTRVAFAVKHGDLLQVFRVDSSAPPLALRGPEGADALVSLAFDKSGDTLLSGSQHGVLAAWDSQRGTLRYARQLPSHEATVIAYSPGCDCVAAFSQDSVVYRWRVSDGAALPALKGDAAARYEMGDVSADGARVVGVSWRRAWVWMPGSEGQAQALELTVRDARGHALPAHDLAINAVAFDRSGTRVVTASDDWRARLWDARDGLLLGEMRHSDRVRAAEFSRTGAQVVTAAYDDTVAVWDGETGASLGDDFSFRDNSFFDTGAKFDPNPQHAQLASAAQLKVGDPAIRLWSLRPTGDIVLRDGAQQHIPTRRAAFSPDGQWVATASMDGRVRIWDVNTGQLVPGLDFIRHDRELYGLAFDRSGTQLTTASGDGTAKVWNLKSHSAVELAGHAGPLIYAAFDPSGQRLVTAARNGVAILWDISTRSPHALLPQGKTQTCRLAAPALLSAVDSVADEQMQLWSAVFSPAGDLVVTACENNIAIIWDVASGKPVHLLGDGTAAHGHGEPLNWASFNPQGDKIITTSDDHTARLWRVADGQPLGEPLQHAADELVINASFSPDGLTVATTTTKGRLYFWDVTSGHLKAIKYVSDGQLLYSVAFDPSGRHGQRVVVAARDGAAYVVNADIDLQGVLERAQQLHTRLQLRPAKAAP